MRLSKNFVAFWPTRGFRQSHVIPSKHFTATRRRACTRSLGSVVRVPNATRALRARVPTRADACVSVKTFASCGIHEILLGTGSGSVTPVGEPGDRGGRQQGRRCKGRVRRNPKWCCFSDGKPDVPPGRLIRVPLYFPSCLGPETRALPKGILQLVRREIALNQPARETRRVRQQRGLER